MSVSDGPGRSRSRVVPGILIGAGAVVCLLGLLPLAFPPQPAPATEPNSVDPRIAALIVFSLPGALLVLAGVLMLRRRSARASPLADVPVRLSPSTPLGTLRPGLGLASWILIVLGVVCIVFAASALSLSTGTTEERVEEIVAFGSIGYLFLVCAILRVRARRIAAGPPRPLVPRETDLAPGVIVDDHPLVRPLVVCLLVLCALVMPAAIPLRASTSSDVWSNALIIPGVIACYLLLVYHWHPIFARGPGWFGSRGFFRWRYLRLDSLNRIRVRRPRGRFRGMTSGVLVGRYGTDEALALWDGRGGKAVVLAKDRALLDPMIREAVEDRLASGILDIDDEGRRALGLDARVPVGA